LKYSFSTGVWAQQTHRQKYPQLAPTSTLSPGSTVTSHLIRAILHHHGQLYPCHQCPPVPTRETAGKGELWIVAVDIKRHDGFIQLWSVHYHTLSIQKRARLVVCANLSTWE